MSRNKETCMECIHYCVCPYHLTGKENEKCVRFFRKQEWISVEERLPDRQGQFLIADEDSGVRVALWMKQLGWVSQFSSNKITHWMPLPEPPKMKGGE